MNPERLNRSLKHIAEAYRAKLSTIPDADFQRTPSIGGWSYSQVYSHIWDASMLSLMALENAYNGKGEKRSTHFLVKLILWYGAFPPAARYKVPKKIEQRVQVISKAEANDFIDQFLTELAKHMGNIANADQSLKSRHPRLGYLNARQWLRFIEIHLNHHLKQIKRIEKTF